MTIQVDGFEFDFTNARNVFVFDETDNSKATYHGLSHAMKAVDLVVELDSDYLFVEVKDFHDPEQYLESKSFDHLREVLKYKYRDTFIYRLAERKADKPVHYCCLLTLDNALISLMNKEMRKQLPCGTPISRWRLPVAAGCAVLNEERWNKNFPKWPVRRIAGGATHP